MRFFSHSKHPASQEKREAFIAAAQALFHEKMPLGEVSEEQRAPLEEEMQALIAAYADEMLEPGRHVRQLLKAQGEFRARVFNHSIAVSSDADSYIEALDELLAAHQKRAGRSSPRLP